MGMNLDTSRNFSPSTWREQSFSYVPNELLRGKSQLEPYTRPIFVSFGQWPRIVRPFWEFEIKYGTSV